MLVLSRAPEGYALRLSMGNLLELREYIRILRKRWRIIACLALVAVVVVGGLGLHATRQYQSHTEFFVSTVESNGDTNSAYNGSLFSEARVTSYSDIMNGPLVAQAASARLGGQPSAEVIQREISASSVTNTVLLNVTVTDPSPQRAHLIAAAIGTIFPPIAKRIEAGGANASPIKVSVVKPATFSNAAVSPQITRDVVLALLLGLLLGVGAAVVRESLDTTVKDANQVQEDLGLPTLGAIAFDPEAPNRPLVVHADPRSPRAEAFRQLRTNLQFIDVDRAPKSLVISSSIPEEGKTTTATNLAITMAQSGLRVLIVEGDLRRPRLANYLGLEGAVGLTSVLAGKVKIADAIQPWGDGQLSVLPSGPIPPNPSELLGSQGMAEVIRELERSFDFVLIDAPPLLPVTDAAVIATSAGGAVLVARHGHTRQKQLAHAVAALHSVGATVYGVVLTMVPTKGPDAYYYGYNYNYDSLKAGVQADTDAPRTPITLRRKTASTAQQTTDNGNGSVSHAESSSQQEPVSVGAAGRVTVDDPVDFFSN
jgi:capsular exopolysaccharide synthesis family protein